MQLGDSLTINDYNSNTVKNEQNSVNDHYHTQSLRNVADKAFELAEKYDTQDEAALSQKEEYRRSY